LAHEKNIKNDNNNSCVILDDRQAKKLIEKIGLEIKCVGLLQVLNFAYQQKLFDKKYIGELVKEMKIHKFRIPVNASDIIYGKKYDSLDKGIKR